MPVTLRKQPSAPRTVPRAPVHPNRTLLFPSFLSSHPHHPHPTRHPSRAPFPPKDPSGTLNLSSRDALGTLTGPGGLHRKAEGLGVSSGMKRGTRVEVGLPPSAEAGGAAPADFTTQVQSSLKVTSTPAGEGGGLLQELWLLVNESPCLGDSLGRGALAGSSPF